MSKIFLITYDLKEPGQDYSELYEAIKGLGDWQHPLESMWLVKVNDFIVAQKYMTLCVRKLMKMIYYLS